MESKRLLFLFLAFFTFFYSGVSSAAYIGTAPDLSFLVDSVQEIDNGNIFAAMTAIFSILSGIAVFSLGAKAILKALRGGA